MVKTINSIILHAKNRKFNLKQNLICRNYGSYATEYKLRKM